MKTCSKCGEVKPLTEFSKDTNKRAGLRSRCKACINVDSAQYRADNPEKVKVSFAKWYESNPEANCVHSHNRRARERAIGGKLSTDLAERLFKLQRGKCACCKQPLGDKFHRDHHMPLALGGANEDWNVQLLCPTCNLQKSAKHPIDFMQSKGFLL